MFLKFPTRSTIFVSSSLLLGSTDIRELNTQQMQSNAITGNATRCNCSHTQLVSNQLVHEVTYSRYRCSRCRRHGIEAVKKFHTCPFLTCVCEMCNRFNGRREIPIEINPITNAGSNTAGFLSDINTLPVPCSNVNHTMSEDIKVIHSLLSLLNDNDITFRLELIDYSALSRFFAQKNIEVPIEWAPHMDQIIELVHFAIKKIPRLSGHEFH